MAVGKRVRFEVFKRDKFACQYCGRCPPAVTLEVDHVVPQSDGGPDDPLNLITACEDCNRGKSNVPLDEATNPLVEQLADAVERREQLEAFNQFLMQQREADDQQVAKLGQYWCDLMSSASQKGKWTVAKSPRGQSIRVFIRRLPIVQVQEAMDIAHNRINATLKHDDHCWRYFCGVCWNMIRAAEGEDR